MYTVHLLMLHIRNGFTPPLVYYIINKSDEINRVLRVDGNVKFIPAFEPHPIVDYRLAPPSTFTTHPSITLTTPLRITRPLHVFSRPT